MCSHSRHGSFNNTLKRLMCVFLPPFRVKPAAFDLFLGGCIAAYLGIVYYAIQVCSCNLWYLARQSLFLHDFLQAASSRTCSHLKLWLMCHFFAPLCLFSLPEFWLSLHKAQSGGEIQTPVTEDWTPCTTDSVEHKCDATRVFLKK